MAPNMAKASAVPTWFTPKYMKYIQKILGSIGYYVRFVQYYVTMAALLSDSFESTFHGSRQYTKNALLGFKTSFNNCACVSLS